MSPQRDSDYDRARRVHRGDIELVRVPIAVMGQLLWELDDDARAYANEALGPRFVQALIDLVSREQDDDTEQAAA
jgi:hypothetical protein